MKSIQHIDQKELELSIINKYKNIVILFLIQSIKILLLKRMQSSNQMKN